MADKGIAFSRYCKALLNGQGERGAAAAYAAGQAWGDTPGVERVLKAAVAAGTTTDATWAGGLSDYVQMNSEFAALLRPMTIIGKLTRMRRVPPNIQFMRQSSGALVGWLGEGAPAPLGKLDMERDSLRFAKAGGTSVFTNELARAAGPAAEAMIRDDMLAGMVEFLDQQFIDPAVAGVGFVSPSSITHGITPIASSGDDIDSIVEDFRTLFAQLVDAGITLAAPALIMSQATAVALATKVTTDGALAFPTITATGGSLFGVPVVTSGAVPASVSGGSIIVLVDQVELQLADDGLTTLDASEQASLQMRDNPQTGATTLVSLWQTGATAVRAIRWINWRRRRDAAVAYLDGVHY